MDSWINQGVDSSTVLWGQFIIYSIYCLAIISVIAWFASKLGNEKKTRINISPKLFYSWLIFLIVCGVGLHITTFLTIPWSRVDLSGKAGDQMIYLSIGWDTSGTTDKNLKNPDLKNIGTPQWSIPVDASGVATTPIEVQCGTLVQFSVQSVASITYTTDYATAPSTDNADAQNAGTVRSGDTASRPALTYGFGIFTQDNATDKNNAMLVAQMQVVPGHSNDLTWMFIGEGYYNIMSTEYSGPLGSDVTVKNAIHASGDQCTK